MKSTSLNISKTLLLFSVAIGVILASESAVAAGPTFQTSKSTGPVVTIKVNSDSSGTLKIATTNPKAKTSYPLSVTKTEFGYKFKNDEFGYIELIANATNPSLYICECDLLSQKTKLSISHTWNKISK